MGYVIDALSRSDHYYVKEILEHLGSDAFAAVEGFLSAMKPAIKVMVTTTAAGAVLGAVGGSFFFGIGAAPGAVFGAEAGAEAGVALLTLMGLGYLIPWVGETLDEVGACLKQGTSTAWNSSGSSTQVDQAAQQFGHARALLARAILQALIQYALAKGMKAASERLRSAKGGQQAIDWLERNVARPYGIDLPLIKNPRLLAKHPGPIAEDALIAELTSKGFVQVKRGSHRLTGMGEDSDIYMRRIEENSKEMFEAVRIDRKQQMENFVPAKADAAKTQGELQAGAKTFRRAHHTLSKTSDAAPAIDGGQLQTDLPKMVEQLDKGARKGSFSHWHHEKFEATPENLDAYLQGPLAGTKRFDPVGQELPPTPPRK